MWRRRSARPYQPSTLTRCQDVAGSASRSSKLGRRAPLTRGRPSVPGIRGGAGSYRPASSRSREIMHRCRPPSRKSSIAEKLLSPTAITRRPGSQRAVWSSPCRAQSVSFLCRWPRSVAERSEGASMVRKGRAHTHPAHGIGASSITHNQRRPLALTKWPWLDRTGSPSIPRALILAPQRRSIVSSRPITTDPCGTRAATRSSRSRCAMAREDQRPRLSTRWETANPASWSRPMTRSAAVTVRRPGARTTPATRTRTWRQTAEVKKQPKGCLPPASASGTLVGMAQTSAWVVAPGDQPLRAEVVTMAGANAMRERIAAHPWPRGGVEVIRANRGYTLYSRRTGGPVARLRPTGKADNVQVLWWRREAWATPGDFRPLILPLDEALDFVAPEGFFWINA